MEAGFEEIGFYITRRKNTVAQYIATQPIMDLCERYVQRLGAWVSRQCWYQEGIHMEGVKERLAAESDRERDECGSGSTQKEMPGQN